VQVILSDLVTTVRYNMVVRSFFSGNGVIFCRSVVQCVCVWVCDHMYIPYRAVPYHTRPYPTIALHCVALHSNFQYITLQYMRQPIHALILVHPCILVGSLVHTYACT
jgi:hypothetical protein